MMMREPGLFDVETRLRDLSAKGDDHPAVHLTFFPCYFWEGGRGHGTIIDIEEGGGPADAAASGAGGNLRRWLAAT
jgi:hypothetical protein